MPCQFGQFPTINCPHIVAKCASFSSDLFWNQKQRKKTATGRNARSTKKAFFIVGSRKETSSGGWRQRDAEAAASVATSASSKDCLEDIGIVAVVVAELKFREIQREIGGR